ncbi:MAG: type IV toxin-antitoxin system AbiEi family antitoxin domain-containing protein [Candidatus Latescibacteria bacterium]|nr:type IV toxin-antitoxin system AbiEi family antitoxin domain-containing protein [Candidatus Latescibacterota bacterium]
MTKRAPSRTTKDVLRILSRGSHGGLFSVNDAARLLGVSTRLAAIRLAGLARQGWLIRVRRGLYSIVPLEALPSKSTTGEDPWIVANVLFTPCYIGGWTAAEYWGLTEQLFRSTFVVTAANVRSSAARFLNLDFRIARVAKSRLVGATKLWRGTEQVLVSDREKTIVDGLSSPEWVGGIRHLAEMLDTYLRDPTRSLDKLTKRLQESERGAAGKRLGYLIDQRWPDLEPLRNAALELKTTGYIRLDPAISSRGRLNKKWGVWVNVPLERGRHD